MWIDEQDLRLGISLLDMTARFTSKLFVHRVFIRIIVICVTILKHYVSLEFVPSTSDSLHTART